ncbi:hypothetical protein CHARACLAT_001573 [Characodon lateralis]|uniref:Uncharacterized protein n=1 Tax=Characodon lateralis TaxID=208331 RepID=A0ABU7EFJ2_9TELE|nr:hypothetical protein [Characodon lateralis]
MCNPWLERRLEGAAAWKGRRPVRGYRISAAASCTDSAAPRVCVSVCRSSLCTPEAGTGRLGEQENLEWTVKGEMLNNTLRLPKSPWYGITCLYAPTQRGNW